MFKQFAVRSNQVFETLRFGGFKALVLKTFCWNREIVFVEMSLPKLNLKSKTYSTNGLEFIEIANWHNNYELSYPLKSRHLKVIKNLNKGYEAFAVIRNMKVIGDVWYVYNDSSSRVLRHPDLKWLGLKLNSNEVYMFDMYTDPHNRGKGLVNYLFSSSLQALKNRGFQKVYGYYEVDNLAALWMHRTMGFKEIQRIKIRKIFSYIKATVVNSSI